MKKKRILLILITIIIIISLMILVKNEIENKRIQDLHSSIDWTSDNIYKLLSDSPSFQIEQTYYDLVSQHCNYNTGWKDIILTQVRFEGDSYVVCITTYDDWKEAWNHAEDWNSWSKGNDWAIGKIMYSYGAVLVQINPINENFLNEFTSLVSIE